MDIPDQVYKYVMFDYLDLGTAVWLSSVLGFDDDEKLWKSMAGRYKFKKKKSQTYLSKCTEEAEKFCEACCLEKGTANELYNMRLCKSCKMSPNYRTVVKSVAKETYFLNDTDLCDVRKTYSKNPHYKSGPMMTLYCEKDVVGKFCEKYDVTEENMEITLKELAKKKKEMGAKIKAAKKSAVDVRKAKLVKALGLYKLGLRKDSNLCNGFINGTIKDWSVDGIVERMCQMKYLYDYCDMDGAYEKAVKRQDDELEAGYFPDCPVFDEAEMIALEEHGGGYPDVFPWMI